MGFVDAFEPYLLLSFGTFVFFLSKQLALRGYCSNISILHCGKNPLQVRSLLLLSWWSPWRSCAASLGLKVFWSRIYTTDKRTDAWWDIFMIWKIDFGLLAVGWAGLWNKKFGPIMSNFWGRFFQLFVGKKKKKNFENILASALKSCIEKKVNFLIFLFFWGKNFFFQKNLFFLGLKIPQ
jgi:hypothetical protein